QGVMVMPPLSDDRAERGEQGAGRRLQPARPAFPHRRFGDQRLADIEDDQLRLHAAFGSTRIFTCASGSPRSLNAWATPSSGTLPVTTPETSMVPSAMCRRVPANSSGV